MRLLNRKDKLATENMLFSATDLRKLIVPLFLQQVLNVLVGTVDSLMVASAGEAAVSGVSLVGTLDTLLVIFFTSLVAGGSVVLSQTLGRKNHEAACEAAKQILYIVTALSVILTVIVLTFRGPLLNLLFGDVEADVMASASGYFFFVALSFPLLAINYSVGACFNAAGKTRISLTNSIIINMINVAGNAIFIFGFKLGAVGAALATLFARFAGTVIMLIKIHNKDHAIHIEKIFRYKPDFSVIGKVVRIGVPNGIESAMFQFGRLLTQSLISTMGTSVIAGNAVALTVCGYQYMTGTACSSAMITVVGRSIGAGESKQAKHYSRVILAINYIAIWTVILFTVIMMRPIISAYNLSAESGDITRTLILYHCAFAAVIWPIGFMLPSSFRAVGDVRFSLVVSMATMWIFRVAGSYVLALDSISVFGLFSIPGFGMGIMGVWVAMTVDWVFRSTLFFIHYLRLYGRLDTLKKL